MLQKQMERMFRGGYFDMLVKGFSQISGGLSKAVKNFSDTIFDPKNKNNMADFFKSTANNAGSFGSIVGNVLSGFLALMKNIDPLISRFAIFLNRKTSTFAKNMTANGASISAFFRNAGNAAAEWGAIFGKVGQRFKDFLKANVGPGTGGQLLLDWLKGGTSGFRGLDGAASDFARKNHFLAAAENLKAMLQSVGKIFGFLTDIGTSPEVAVFWKTLEGLEEPLARIFAGITGSGEAFAKLAVAVVEVFAAFADSAQLKAYMDILSTVANFAANTLESLRPLFQALGPLIGAIGALISILLVSGKVIKLVLYPLLLLTKGYVALTKALLVIRGAYVAYATVKGTTMALEKSGLALSAVQRASMYKEIIARVVSTKATESQAIAIGKNTAITSAAAIANGTLATTNAAVGASATGAIGPIATMGATLWSALAPVLPIVLAIAAAIALIAGGILIYNSIKADNSKKALKSLGKDFDDLKGKSLGAAEAQRSWQSALLSVDGASRTGIESVTKLGDVLNATGNRYGRLTIQTSQQAAASQALDTYMTGLSKLAKKSLPEAQRQFRNMVVVGNLNRAATTKAITTNEDYVAALEKQANAMGETIKNADGSVNAIKAVDYALGEGSYLRRKAVLENQALAQAYKDAAASFIDTSSAMQKATNGSKFSLSTYLKEIRSQIDGLTKWRSNLVSIKKLFGADAKYYSDIVKMGAAGAGLVASLEAGGQAAVDQYIAVQKEADAATQSADAYARATTNVAAVLKAAAKGGRVKADRADQMVAEGLTAAEIQMKLGISDSAVVAAQSELDKVAPDLAGKIDIQAGWANGTIGKLKEKLITDLGATTVQISATGVTSGTGRSADSGGGYKTPGQKVKGGANGGLFTAKAIKRYANGGSIPRFADGWSSQMYPNGLLSGPGGPRTDSILARVATGEFIVNAAATRRNLDLLHAINDNKTISSGAPTTNNNISINVNAAPGMNEQDVANLVSSKLTYELQRGFTS